MRIALIGQAAFGEAAFGALRDAGRGRSSRCRRSRARTERPDPLWAAAGAAGIARFPTGELKKPDVLEAYAATEPELCVMAFVTHILPERVLDGAALGHDPVPPVAAAAAPRHQLDALGDPAGRRDDGADDLLGRRGHRHRAGAAAARVRDRAGRHRRLAVLRQAVPAGRRGAGGVGAAGARGRRAEASRRTMRRRRTSRRRTTRTAASSGCGRRARCTT